MSVGRLASEVHTLSNLHSASNCANLAAKPYDETHANPILFFLYILHGTFNTFVICKAAKGTLPTHIMYAMDSNA